jgi:hypothetical protein
MTEETLGREEHARAVERRAVVEERLKKDVRSMIDVLKVDIPGFFAREAKRRFLAAADFADKLSQEQVGKLKLRVQEAGEVTASDVVRALEDPRTWTWDASHPLPESSKSLDAHPRVAPVLSRIGLGLSQTLAQLGFPDAESAKDAYKLPSYFVAGFLMTRLVENYWRDLQEQVELTRLIDESAGRERRDKLTKKWDEA